MKSAALFAISLTCLAGCSQERSRLECILQEQSRSDRTVMIFAQLSEPNTEGVQDLEGSATYTTGLERIEAPIRGVYLSSTGGRELELLTFSDLPNGKGKLNITVQPEHPVLKQRGTAAVILTGSQTVHDGAPARATCRTVEQS